MNVDERHRARSGASSRIDRRGFLRVGGLPACPAHVRGVIDDDHPCARALRMRADALPLQGAAKFLDLLVRLFSSDTITFLDLAGEVFAIALGNREIVISELAPLRLELAGELFPLPLDLVFVHENLRAPVNRRAVVNEKIMQ